MGIRVFTGRLLIVALTGAGPGAAGAPAQSGSAQVDRDSLEVTNYRLSMAVVRKIDAVYTALAATMQKDPRVQRLAKAKAEREALEAKEDPSAAEQARMEKLSEEIERLSEEVEGKNLDDYKTLADMARKIDATPELAAAVRQGGMTSREFATAQLALFSAMFAHGFMKSGALKELPKDVNAENVKFIQAHETELERLFARWKAMDSK